jgi:hypothetical protein
MQPTATTVATGLGEPATTEAAPAAAGAGEAVLRYLRAFGPATTSDIRTWSWLAGVREIVDRLRPSLRTYRDEAGRELLDVADGLFADPSAEAPVRFLPEYDNVFLSHADRTRITGDLRWGAAFAHLGTFFVDGFLAGAWKLTDGALSVRPMMPLDAAQHDEVESEARALLAFLVPKDRRQVQIEA